jgi:hypothetical protein
MATIKKGILGPFSGSISNIVGYERLGTPCIRGKGDPQPQNFTDKQLAHQLRVRLANSFINPSKTYINIGFSKSTTGGQTAHNVAISHALKTGTKGEFPNLEIDFEKLLVSDGDLPQANNPQLELQENTKLMFSWDYDENFEFPNHRDQVMLLAYSPETKRSFYTIGGAKRSSRTEILEIYPELENERFETYISFIQEDRKSISPSIYTGRVTASR